MAQASDTGLSNAFISFKLTVEVALWPPLTVLGLSADAEIEKSVPVLSSTLIKFEVESSAIRSGALSPSKSATTPIVGFAFVPAEKVAGCWNVPSPLPSNTVSRVLSELLPTRSRLPSPFDVCSYCSRYTRSPIGGLERPIAISQPQ